MTSIKRILIRAFCFVLVISFFSFSLPLGWIKTGSTPEKYDMGIDSGSGQDGKNAATIKSIDSKKIGYGTLMQNSFQNSFLGKRVRMEGMVKTKDVAEWSGLWLRIDQKGSSENLGFDNMHDGSIDRSIKGTTNWAKYEIVLDIPKNAVNMAYGAFLVGPGQIWFSNIKFEAVETTVPTTGSGTTVPDLMPTNLDFDN